MGEYCQFDCGWYTSIIEHGYDKQPHVGGSADAANWPFFPLFPLFAKPLNSILGLPPGLAAVVGSKVALCAAVLAFLILVRSEDGSLQDCVLAGTLVAFNPVVIFAHGGYAEPLYFAIAASGFALLQRRLWVPAGWSGALLSATRMVGVVFSLSYAISCVRAYGLRTIFRERRLDIILGALLCPLGLSLWMLYMHHRTGDALASVHIYVAWGVSRTNPLTILWEGYRHSRWPRLWTLTAIAGWAMSIWLARQREYEQAVFLAITILIPAMAEVAGMPRHVWWQPPVLYGTYLLLKRHPSLQSIYFAFAGGVAVLMTYLWMTGSSAAV